jgi:hypothetical protein
VGKELRVIFALDDDPIFGRVLLTLFRVVRRQDLEDAYRKTALGLYGERLLAVEKKDEGKQAGSVPAGPSTMKVLNVEKEGRRETGGRQKRRPAGSLAGEAAPRRVRSNSGGDEGPSCR